MAQLHAISPLSANVCVERDAPRQSGHLRTAPDAVRLSLTLILEPEAFLIFVAPGHMAKAIEL